jgi:Cys-rich four helix bundle protein (predicted Tat secretion target)
MTAQRAVKEEKLQRRSFMATLGLSALATATDAAPESRPTPSQAPVQRTGYKELADASGLCLSAAEACLRRAFKQVASKDGALTDCASASADVIAACAALLALAAANAPFAAGFARTVADVCVACKKDCERFPQIPECVALSAACANCAAACRKAAG